MLINASTCLVYPYALAYGFKTGAVQMAFLVIAEIFILVDIVFNFFLTYQEEGHTSQEKDFMKISKRYLFGKFKKDIFVFLPLGLLGEINNGAANNGEVNNWNLLRLLWLLKLNRLGNVQRITDEKFFNPILR